MQKSSLSCDHCGGNGHTKEGCFFIKGFPEWHRLHGVKHDPSKMPKFLKNKAPGHCSNLSNTNMPPLLESPSANFIYVSSSSDSYSHSVHMMDQQPIISAEHFTSNFLTNSSVVTPLCFSHKSKHATSWIIDTGATYHGTSNFSLLPNPITISNTTIQLSNGQSSSITHKGTVYITDSTVLQNVLYVPNFHYNLVSGNKLSTDSNYCLLFYPSHCILQDLVTQKGKGIGRIQDGLYVLVSHIEVTDASLVSSNVNNGVSSFTWHSRLAHLTYSDLSHIPALSCTKSHSSVCDVCHYAKQPRIPFSIKLKSCFLYWFFASL